MQSLLNKKLQKLVTGCFKNVENPQFNLKIFVNVIVKLLSWNRLTIDNNKYSVEFTEFGVKEFFSTIDFSKVSTKII